MPEPSEKKADTVAPDGKGSAAPRLSTEEFFKILDLPACKSKGYCDNCGRCER